MAKQSLNNWIKISDKKPKVGKDVLTWDGMSIKRAHIMTAAEKRMMTKIRRTDYTEGIWWDDCELFHPIDSITHWMPFPEPPKN